MLLSKNKAGKAHAFVFSAIFMNFTGVNQSLKSKPTRNRATRADWLEAALAALYEQGPKGLNIQALARRLNISKTSFYWHFKDKAELTNALVDFWRHEFTETVTENVKLMDSPPRQRLAMAMELVD